MTPNPTPMISALPLAASTRWWKFTRCGATKTPMARPSLSAPNATSAIRRLPAGPAAAMLAARHLNDQPEVPVYGVATNGRVWECGRLDPTGLALDRHQFTLGHLDELCAAINYVFDQCRRQVVDPSRAA